MKKKIYIKHKIFNHLMVNGKKETTEKHFLKSFKQLQKSLNKNVVNITKIGIINSKPIVSINNIKTKKKKKNIKEYSIVLEFEKRLSLAIKFSLSITKNKDINLPLYNILKQELVYNSQNNSNATKKKENLQKNSLLNKKYAYYRWF